MFEDNLTLDACRDRLHALQERNDELEQHTAFMRSDVRMKMESKVEDLRAHVEDAISALSQSIVEHTCSFSSASCKPHPPRPPFARKVFVPQESPLSKMLLYDDENYKTLFNIGVVCLVLWGAAMVLDDVDKYGSPNFDLLLWGIINDLGPFFKHWLLIFAISFVVIPLSHIWAESRSKITGLILGVVYASLQLWMFKFSASIVFSSKAHLAMPLAMGFMVKL